MCADNKVTDQPVHPHRLISAFFFRLSGSIISRPAMSKISIFYLVSVAEQAGLNITLSEVRRQVFTRHAQIRDHNKTFLISHPTKTCLVDTQKNCFNALGSSFEHQKQMF